MYGTLGLILSTEAGEEGKTVCIVPTIIQWFATEAMLKLIISYIF